ncbi:MAG: hypothetical protein K8L97_27250 [Anaerolineae bacterium]|nr:hypothetical protein [Anaerolineae bacterium]
MTSLDVVMPVEVRKVLDRLASEEAEQNRLTGKKKNVYASDIVRRAITAYLAGLGIQLEVDVDRGGDRRSGQQGENSSRLD